MTRRSFEPRHVALIVETSNAYARGLLVGVKQYLTERPGWSIYLGEHSRQDSDLSWLDGWRGDGVLARIETHETATRVRQLGLPAVDLSAARLVPELPCVETHDDVIAAWAVEHFAERGLRHFAFCADDRFRWSQKRGQSFASHVVARGYEPHHIHMEPSGRLADDRLRLAAWLVELPKPIGILACYDFMAQELLEACKIAGVAVPDSVAVLGVDNDELLCNLTSPPLSSVQPDAIRTGYLASELLDAMMSGQAAEPRLHLVDPVRIVTRQSTDVLSVDINLLVACALRYIREHSDRHVPVRMVERHVGVSRRSLDYRFVRCIGRTAHEEIVRVRMERVAGLLAGTDWTLPRIAEHLDFLHAEYMGTAFKKHAGKSPGQYRRASRASDQLRHM